eukprot:scaffold3217_cov221-Alexandrium_tamarense.AAC.16
MNHNFGDKRVALHVQEKMVTSRGSVPVTLEVTLSLAYHQLRRYGKMDNLSHLIQNGKGQICLDLAKRSRERASTPNRDFI